MTAVELRKKIVNLRKELDTMKARKGTNGDIRAALEAQYQNACAAAARGFKAKKGESAFELAREREALVAAILGADSAIAETEKAIQQEESDLKLIEAQEAVRVAQSRVNELSGPLGQVSNELSAARSTLRAVTMGHFPTAGITQDFLSHLQEVGGRQSDLQVQYDRLTPAFQEAQRNLAVAEAQLFTINITTNIGTVTTPIPTALPNDFQPGLSHERFAVNNPKIKLSKSLAEFREYHRLRRTESSCWDDEFLKFLRDEKAGRMRDRKGNRVMPAAVKAEAR
jgi:hypothetical protein